MLGHNILKMVKILTFYKSVITFSVIVFLIFFCPSYSQEETEISEYDKFGKIYQSLCEGTIDRDETYGFFPFVIKKGNVDSSEFNPTPNYTKSKNSFFPLDNYFKGMLRKFVVEEVLDSEGNVVINKDLLRSYHKSPDYFRGVIRANEGTGDPFYIKVPCIPQDDYNSFGRSDVLFIRLGIKQIDIEKNIYSVVACPNPLIRGIDDDGICFGFSVGVENESLLSLYAPIESRQVATNYDHLHLIIKDHYLKNGKNRKFYLPFFYDYSEYQFSVPHVQSMKPYVVYDGSARAGIGRFRSGIDLSVFAGRYATVDEFEFFDKLDIQFKNYAYLEDCHYDECWGPQSSDLVVLGALALGALFLGDVLTEEDSDHKRDQLCPAMRNVYNCAPTFSSESSLQNYVNCGPVGNTTLVFNLGGQCLVWDASSGACFNSFSSASQRLCKK